MLGNFGTHELGLLVPQKPYPAHPAKWGCKNPRTGNPYSNRTSLTTSGYMDSVQSSERRMTLLALTGALIVMMVYYISGSGSGSNFFRFSLSPFINAIHVTSVTLSRLNSINAIDVTRNLRDIFGIFWGYYEDILGIFWGYFGDILGIFWEYFGDILGIFWEYFGNILGIFW